MTSGQRLDLSALPEEISRAVLQGRPGAVLNVRSIVGAPKIKWAGHRLYPYPGRLVTHIPRAFLETQKPGIAVLDPFCGSGTVLLEALVAGHEVVGYDVNPIAVLVSQVKTAQVDAERIVRSGADAAAAAKRMRRKFDQLPFKNADYWYDDTSLTNLARLRDAVEAISDRSVKLQLELAFVRTAEQMSSSDPEIPVPVRLSERAAFSPQLSRRIQRFMDRQRDLGVWGLFDEAVQAVASHASDLGAIPSLGSATVKLTDARLDSGHKNNDFGVILTSPPYLGAQKYMRSATFALGWLGHLRGTTVAELDRRSVGRERLRRSEAEGLPELSEETHRVLVSRVAESNVSRSEVLHAYLTDLERSIRMMSGRTASGGHAILVTSPVVCAGIHVDIPSIACGMAARNGFRLLGQFGDLLRGRRLLTKRHGMSEPVAIEVVQVYSR